MSRHEIPARNPGHKIIVGWDPPMQTFFAQRGAGRRGGR
jgi:hypothetical protein